MKRYMTMIGMLAACLLILGCWNNNTAGTLTTATVAVCNPADVDPNTNLPKPFTRDITTDDGVAFVNAVVDAKKKPVNTGKVINFLDAGYGQAVPIANGTGVFKWPAKLKAGPHSATVLYFDPSAKYGAYWTQPVTFNVVDSGPTPPPPPPPTGKVAKIVLIDDSTRTNAQLQVLDNADYWASVESRGVDYLKLGSADPQAVAYKLTCDPPAYLLQDKDGGFINPGGTVVPDTTAAIEKAIGFATKVFRHKKSKLEAYVDRTGHVRPLGLLPSQGTGKFKAWRTKYTTAIPVSQWWEVDRRKVLGPTFIKDQNGFGACVGFSATNALERARALAGMKYQCLSGMFCYSQINGGVDGGAIIEDAMGILLQTGVCFETEVPTQSKFIRKQNIPQSAYQTALRFEALECYQISSWQELCEAILQDYIPVYPVMVGNSFESLDSEGISGVDSGQGNHSVHGDSLLHSTKYGWRVRLPNTWGTSFGLSGNDAGCCYVREAHVTQTFRSGVGFAVKFPKMDPQEKSSRNGIKDRTYASAL